MIVDLKTDFKSEIYFELLEGDERDRGKRILTLTIPDKKLMNEVIEQLKCHKHINMDISEYVVF